MFLFAEHPPSKPFIIHRVPTTPTQGVEFSSCKEQALLGPPGRARQSQAEPEEQQGPAAGLALAMNLGTGSTWHLGEDFCKGAQARCCPWGLTLLSPHSPPALGDGRAEKPRDPLPEPQACHSPSHYPGGPQPREPKALNVSSMSGAAPPATPFPQTLEGPRRSRDEGKGWAQRPGLHTGPALGSEPGGHGGRRGHKSAEARTH